MSKIEIFIIVIITLTVLSTPLLVYVRAGFEANSYNKFCSTPVTTWDALWLDLRIDECLPRADITSDK